MWLCIYQSSRWDLWSVSNKLEMKNVEAHIAKQEKIPQFLIAGRLALLALALCAASFVHSFSDKDVQNWIFAALGTLFAANLLLALWYKRDPNSLWLKRFQSALDVGIVSGIIFCTGGLSSPYLFLFLPVLFLSRITSSFRNSVGTGLTAVTCYLLVAYLSNPAIFESAPLIRTLIVQVTILGASISLVIFSAQHLMLTISKKEALFTKSQLDLLEQSKDQIELLERLPYGVLSLNPNLMIGRANKKACELLSLQDSQILDHTLPEILSAYSKTKIEIDFPNRKLILPENLPAIFNYEFLAANRGQDQHFFIFQETQEDQLADNPNLLRLEGRLRELLSNDGFENGISPSSRRFVAESLVMKKVFSLIERSAPTDATVLIQGESGTGKELVARALHENSKRAQNAFVTVNCGAIPETLIESTLFGHKKGSFTGAIGDAPGLIREAQGGTLFLDEIGELPLHMQVKLLRVLQERTVRMVGGDREFDVDVRIVAATNKNLKAELDSGGFRDDLFYRLNVINIPLPALRERREDLPVLIHTFLRRLSETHSEGDSVNIASDAMQILLNYDYPGNVRELENILERTYVLGAGSILAEHLSDLVPQRTSKNNHEPFIKGQTNIIESDLVLPLSLDEVLAGVEKKYMVLALEKTQGHRTKAAELLGINLRSFRYRAQKLGL